MRLAAHGGFLCYYLYMDETQSTTALVIPLTLTEYNAVGTYKAGPQDAKTISKRSKLYKLNANAKGWHIHIPAGYCGYNKLDDLATITSDMTSDGYRLTFIGGNVLVFQK